MTRTLHLLLKVWTLKDEKNHFYRVKNNFLFVIGLFKDKYGGELSINIGIHIVNYPIRGYFEKTEIPKVTTNGTIIQKTLLLENGNSRLKYGKDKQEGLETINFMKLLISNNALPFFLKFENNSNVFSEIKISDFENPSNKFQEYGIEKKLLSWIHFKIFVARYNFDYGDKKMTNEIIKLVKEEEGVSPLIKEIDKLINEWK